MKHRRATAEPRASAVARRLAADASRRSQVAVLALLATGDLSPAAEEALHFGEVGKVDGLVGVEVEDRRRFIEDNAVNVKDLDV
ncbi:MAG: hypothetical protein V1790_01735 [Planctomycetota bacterium]